ncbi:nucleotidyltransferase family protein [Sphingomonas sp. GlSt437]|uniref:nucleotidyltransferase family protein n=1 Tax=Sphingomonas sp. GlSt437 TaxID=3389970 RepID=UPI003A84F712
MIAADKTVLVLLAAGRSTRFGSADKLEATWRGKPLALHAVQALKAVPFAHRVAIVSDTTVDFSGQGFEVIVNPDPDEGLARSLRLGVAAARDVGAAAMLVALADMPRITTEHVQRVLDGAEGAMSIVASSDGAHVKPPALFGAGHFTALAAMTGDAGGRTLLADATRVAADPDELMDIDTIEDLERLRAAG